MRRSERLFAIAEELRRRAPASVSATSLADRFGVSRRTIERDIESLRGAGVSLAADVGRTGGYWLDQRPGKDLFMLTGEEVVALLLATRAAAGMPFSEAATAATARLLDALPPATRVAMTELRNRILAAETGVPRARPPIRRATEQAVRDQVVVKISYRDANGATTTRAVEAHGFYGATDGWYLVGWCRLRNAGRIFRLDRITRATPTKERFVPQPIEHVLGWVPHQTHKP